MPVNTTPGPVIPKSASEARPTVPLLPVPPRWSRLSVSTRPAVVVLTEVPPTLPGSIVIGAKSPRRLKAMS